MSTIPNMSSLPSMSTTSNPYEKHEHLIRNKELRLRQWANNLQIWQKTLQSQHKSVAIESQKILYERKRLMAENAQYIQLQMQIESKICELKILENSQHKNATFSHHKGNNLPTISTYMKQMNGHDPSTTEQIRSSYYDDMFESPKPFEESEMSTKISNKI